MQDLIDRLGAAIDATRDSRLEAERVLGNRHPAYTRIIESEVMLINVYNAALTASERGREVTS